MSQSTVKKIHLIYGGVLSTLIVVTGVLLIVSCVDIYRSGNRPFSRESIGAHFDAIAVPVYATIAAVIGGIVLSAILPLEKSKPKARRDECDTLAGLRKKVGSAVPTTEATLRLALRAGTAVVASLLGIYPALYFFEPSHFGLADINGSVIGAVVPSLLWAVLVLALSFLCSVLCSRSVRREIDACKAFLSEHRDTPEATAPHTPFAERFGSRNKALIVLVVRCVLLAVAVVFIVLGVLNGGIDDVLGKAIRICTECIGLG